MENTIKDAIYCLSIINGFIESRRGIGKIYRNTNENLSIILSNYDFRNKDVLSVLASSDQVFASYYLGASNVDTFDSNILTYYYYFLKKWTILKTGKPYIPASNDELLEIIKIDSNMEEEIKASYFWKYVLTNVNSSLYYSNLFYKEPILYKLPYENDINYLKKIIIDKKLNYNKFDLFKPLYVDKKYQIIILSNMLEYLYDSEENINMHNIAAKNIYNLLEDDGIAISSNIIDYKYKGNPIFEKYLEYIEGPIARSNIYDTNKPICYIYRKRKEII